MKNLKKRAYRTTLHSCDGFCIDQLQAQLIMLPSILNFDKYPESLMHIVDVLSTLPKTTHCWMYQVERPSPGIGENVNER